MKVYGDLIPKAEAARRLRVSPATINRHIKTGYLPSQPDPETGRPLISWRSYEACQDRRGQLKAEQEAA